MMTRHKKIAIEILEKINNQRLTQSIWDKASDYAKNELKRKGLVVVDTVIEGYEFVSVVVDHPRIMDNLNFWDGVKTEMINLKNIE